MKFNLLQYFLLKGIKFYQHHLSPKKGYSCSYRLVYGGSGCSGVGYRLIRRYGFFKGLILLHKRFKNCANARSQLYSQSPYFSMGLATKQSGHSDCCCFDSCERHYHHRTEGAEACCWDSVLIGFLGCSKS